MLRVILVLVSAGALGALLAWIVPPGWLERALEVFVGTDALLLTIISFIAILQWLTIRRGLTQDSMSDDGV